MRKKNLRGFLPLFCDCDKEAMSESTPYYPDQGTQVTADAVYSLLPAGLDAGSAKILFIHAHPDDESSSTGATMGLYSRQGAEVSLITATRGEMGEVIPEDLKHLEVGNPSNSDAGAGLAKVREAELAQALQVLQVSNHAFLGQGFTSVAGTPERYQDSGMSWGADGKATANPAAAQTSLTLSPLEPQAHAIAVALRTLRPDVVVTYDSDGGYGHPDHVRVHQMTVAALRQVIGTEFEPRLVWGIEGEFAADDTRLQAVIDGDLAAKRAAMAAHLTQVTVTSETTFEYSNKVPQKISARETYRLLWSAEGVEADRTAPATAAASEPGKVHGTTGATTGTAQREQAGEEVIPSTANSLITAVCLGLLTGVAGTIYHAYIWYHSETVFLPWGAFLAVLTLTLACIWVNLRAANSWPGVITALTAFLLTFLFSTLKGAGGYLVLLNPAHPIGLAGTIWSLGTLVAALISTVVFGIYRRRTPRPVN